MISLFFKDNRHWLVTLILFSLYDWCHVLTWTSPSYIEWLICRTDRKWLKWLDYDLTWQFWESLKLYPISRMLSDVAVKRGRAAETQIKQVLCIILELYIYIFCSFSFFFFFFFSKNDTIILRGYWNSNQKFTCFVLLSQNYQILKPL